jgi:hypothetical protein
MSLKNLNLAWDTTVSGATEGASFYLTFLFLYLTLQSVQRSLCLCPSSVLKHGSITKRFLHILIPVQMTARYYGAKGAKYTKSYNANASSFKKGEAGVSMDCDEVSITQLPTSFQVMFKRYTTIFNISDEFDVSFTLTPTSNGFNFPVNAKNVSLGGEEGIFDRF